MTYQVLVTDAIAGLGLKEGALFKSGQQIAQVFWGGPQASVFCHQDSVNYDDQDDQPDEDNAEKGERRKSCGVWHKHSDWEHCHPAFLGEEVRDCGGDSDDDWW